MKRRLAYFMKGAMMVERMSATYLLDYLVPKIIAEEPELCSSVDAVFGIELLGERGGYWTLDLTGTPSIERGRAKEPVCALISNVDDFEDLVTHRNPLWTLRAVKKRRLRASGNWPCALKLADLLIRLAEVAEYSPHALQGDSPCA